MEYLLYILAGGWSLTLTICAIWGIAEGWSDSALMGLISTFVIGPLVGFIAAAPWLIWSDAESPDLVTLKKHEWVCVARHSETTMMPIATGKTTTMVPQTTEVCDQYSRIAQ